MTVKYKLNEVSGTKYSLMPSGLEINGVVKDAINITQAVSVRVYIVPTFTAEQNIPPDLILIMRKRYATDAINIYEAILKNTENIK